ncbi:MAG TPA: AraC family transcriptional regulator, partial [Blastocatellia bacterium]|nr:AraC family transcriptional regulator [Blastocatellia bacterium]
MQGGKRVLLGEEVFWYDPGHYLIFTVDLPVVFQVEEASEERPYFGCRLNLDLSLVASVMMESGIEIKKGDASIKAINVSSVDADLLDALEEGKAMTTIQIKSATESNQEQAIAVIVLAFATDPVTRWAYPDPHQYLSYFPDLVSAFGGNAFEHGTGYYADGFSGAALWLPPEVHPREEEMMALLKRTVPERNQEEVFSVLEQMGGHHPTEP